jgi:GNAT superfamily N-acetyltransferase
MKDLIRKLLKEGLNDNLTYTEEHLGSNDGQDNYELGLYLNDEIVGMVQYVIFEGELTVSDVIVRPEFRRQGFGSRMMQYIKKIHPEAEYKPSMMTDLGSAFKHKEIPDLNTLDEVIDNNVVLPKELRGRKYVKRIIGQEREFTSGIINYRDLMTLSNGIENAKNHLATDIKFKPSKNPIVVGVDIETGIKQLLDGYHRYVSMNGMGVHKAYFIPMKDGDIISFDEIK